MIITYYTKQFVKIQFGNLVIASNPVSKKSEAKGSKFGADIALVSFPHPDFSGYKEVTYGDREPFVINGPGEYEVQETFIKGLGVKAQYNGSKGINTIYEVTLEGMNLLFMGALSEKDIPDDVLGEIDEVDILFIPISGDGLISASQAHSLGVKLESKIIIPLGFETEKDKDLKTFLKEESSGEVKALDKLTVKKSDISGKEAEIQVLLPQVS